MLCVSKYYKKNVKYRYLNKSCVWIVIRVLCISSRIVFGMLTQALSGVFYNVGYSLIIFKTDQDVENSISIMEEQRYFRKRKYIILTIICCLILVFFGICFGYYRSWHAEELEEFSCHAEDSVCTSLLCPDGMDWDQDVGECHLPGGYQCCQDGAGILTCYNTEKKGEKDNKCKEETLTNGVAPSPRTFCYPGFVWVPWRRKCFRKV